MCRLFADENIEAEVVRLLSDLGYDVVTAQECGLAGMADSGILRAASIEGRAVITHDYRDYRRLLLKNPSHSGIIACTWDRTFSALAERIRDIIVDEASLQGRLIRVIRPSR